MSEDEKIDLNKMAKEAAWKFMKEVSDLKTTTKVLYFLPEKIRTMKRKPKDVKEIYNITLKSSEFFIEPTLKEEIIDAISMASSEMRREPFIVLVPQSKVHKKSLHRNMKYPIQMFGKNKVYFVKGINEVQVYETE